MRKRTNIILRAVFVLLLSTPSLALALDLTKHPEVKEEVRRKVALEKLQKEENSIAIYVKGLCCPACSIGVRRKISRLDGVDVSRFTQGVDLDPKYQIATVAVTAGQTPSISDLWQAVDDSGYEAVLLYTLKDGEFETKEFSAP